MAVDNADEDKKAQMQVLQGRQLQDQHTQASGCNCRLLLVKE